MDFNNIFNVELLNEVGAEIHKEVRSLVKTAAAQISSSSNTIPDNSKVESEYIFTTKFYEKADEFGLSEADALDVYYTGELKGTDVLVRVYNGYALGIEFELDSQSGKPVIKSIWKNEIL